MAVEVLQRLEMQGINLVSPRAREGFIDSLSPEDIGALGLEALDVLDKYMISDGLRWEGKDTGVEVLSFGNDPRGLMDFCDGLSRRLERWLRQYNEDFGFSQPKVSDPAVEEGKTVVELPDPVGFLTGDEQVYAGIVYLPVPSTGNNNNRETILEPRPNLVRVARTALAVKGLVPYSLVDIEGLLPEATNGV